MLDDQELDPHNSPPTQLATLPPKQLACVILISSPVLFCNVWCSLVSALLIYLGASVYLGLTRDVGPVLAQCWASNGNAGPALR